MNKEATVVTHSWLDDVLWNEQGLVPAIAQDAESGRVLMMAWMNRESLALTVKEGVAIYYSRSRKGLWRKGESSGNTQVVKALQLDCYGDTIVIQVVQKGGIACHTGRESCFYRTFHDQGWSTTEPVLKDPKDLYG